MLNTCTEHSIQNTSCIVTFEGYTCPICKKIEEMEKKYDTEIGGAEDQITDLSQKVKVLEDQQRAVSEAMKPLLKDLPACG